MSESGDDGADGGKALEVTRKSIGKVSGSSPSLDLYYIVVLFDISEPKKYRLLTKILKSYGSRVQKSVFEGQLRASQVKEMTMAVERLMRSERYYNPDDNVRIYRIAGNCEMTVFGTCADNTIEEDMFF